MRVWLSMIVVFVGALALGAPDAPGTFRFRVGPFFEWGSREGEGMTRFAIRPFYAWEKPEGTRADEAMEVLWPISHFAWRGDAFNWRVLLGFWWERDRTERTSRDYHFSIPPLWQHGRVDETDDYWAFFPFYGRMPKFLLVEDAEWVLFPLWLRYRTGGSRGIVREYYVWPFFSLKHDEDRTRWALWPFYGTKHEPGVDSRFVLWPFWNDHTYHAKRHHGTAWMLWPIVSRVNTNSEWGGGVLPPFFEWRHTNDGKFLLRCPWPLFERYRDANESTWKLWRFWGMTTRGTRSGWWFLHPIVQSTRQRTAHRLTYHRRFWPFYVDERSVTYEPDGREHEDAHYFRIWPFYSSAHSDDKGLRRRALELFPLRDLDPVERNWAPFWTFYTATRRPGEKETRHELFWGLIWWHTQAEDEEESLMNAPTSREATP